MSRQRFAETSCSFYVFSLEISVIFTLFFWAPFQPSHLVFVSASPSLTWADLYSPSPSCPCSPCSREPPHKVPEPKRPSPPPGRTTRWTSAWTSWVRGCSRPNPCSPASTPCNKVRGAAEPRRPSRAGGVSTKLHVIHPPVPAFCIASAERQQSVGVDAVKCSR